MENWHIDHIMPTFEYDLEDPDEVKRAFHPANLRWLRGKENVSKGKKITDAVLTLPPEVFPKKWIRDSN